MQGAYAEGNLLAAKGKRHRSSLALPASKMDASDVAETALKAAGFKPSITETNGYTAQWNACGQDPQSLDSLVASLMRLMGTRTARSRAGRKVYKGCPRSRHLWQLHSTVPKIRCSDWLLLFRQSQDRCGSTLRGVYLCCKRCWAFLDTSREGRIVAREEAAPLLPPQVVASSAAID